MEAIGANTIDLVITAPDPFGPLLSYRTRSRTTIGVLTQIITEAKSRLVMGAPFMHADYGLSSGPISDALISALHRGLDVDILGTGPGLRTVVDSNLNRAGRGNLRLWQPSSNLSNEELLGSHAKFCVADGNVAYVGSANLTYRGLYGQVELGVLIRGPLAQQIEDFLGYSKDIRLLVPFTTVAQ